MRDNSPDQHSSRVIRLGDDKSERNGHPIRQIATDILVLANEVEVADEGLDSGHGTHDACEAGEVSQICSGRRDWDGGTHIAEEMGMLNDGAVTATATALHADTDGAEKAQVSYSSGRMTQGYALMKRTKMPGASHTAMKVPMAWAYHWERGGVRRRKPVRKSEVRVVAMSAAPDAIPPATRLRVCFWLTERFWGAVTPPKTS